MHHIHHRADLIAAIATCIDDHVSLDLALGGLNHPSLIAELLQARDRRMAIDLCPGLARTAGERLAKLRWINIAIHRIPKRAQQGVCGDQRMPLCTFGSVDDFKLNTHAFGHGRKVVIAIEMILGGGQPDAARAVVIINRVVRIIGQIFIEVNRVGFQPHHRLVWPEICHLSRRMPCGARGELIPLDQHAIADAFLCKMVERRATGDPAANHRHLRACFHVCPCL